MTKEQAKNVKEWIAALRSGAYRQGSGILYHNGRYCCLGVAEKVCGVERCADNMTNGESFRRILGLDSSLQGKLAAANDGYAYSVDRERLPRFSFLEIADTLESALASVGKL